MLRITKKADDDRTILQVEGRLVPPWVRELEKSWQQGAGGTSLVLDLRSVTFIDSEGKELLGRIHRSGAKLLSSGIMMNAIVEQLESHSHGKGK